ncbi:hypothetical protein [Phytobacter ursingii]
MGRLMNGDNPPPNRPLAPKHREGPSFLLSYR